MIASRYRQNGATLLVALVMLVVLTLFAISMINSSSLSLKIIGNFQKQKIMEQGARQELENFISSSGSFSTTAAAPAAVCINGTDTSCTDGYHVLISAPNNAALATTCIKSAKASGYSEKPGELAPDDNDWEVSATVVDPADHTKQYMKIVQGMRVRMLAGNCP